MENLIINADDHDDSIMLIRKLIHARTLICEENSPTTPYRYCLFIHSLLVVTTDIIKESWCRPQYKILRKFVRKPTLFHQIESQFPTKEWVECLTIILRLPVASNLIARCNMDCDFYKDGGYFQELFFAFWAKEVRKSDRIDIIRTFLDLGLLLTIHDLDYAIEMFGFNEELEILIYNGSIPIRYGHKFPLTMYIFGLHREFNPNMIYTAFIKLIKTEACLMQRTKEKYLSLSLKYFSMPKDMKIKLKVMSGIYMDNHQKFCETLDSIPVFPSLRELSRNFLYGYVRRTRNFDQVYELHDALKSFDAPPVVIDIIRFKKPIYC